MKPHSPNSVSTYKDKVIVPLGWVSFLTNILIVGTVQDERILLQSFCEVAVIFGSIVKVAVGSNGSIVAVAVGVFVGGGVDVAVLVGGRGVSVGSACWVSATMVNAAACAVPATSAELSVGGCSAPHAASSRLKMSPMGKSLLFMLQNLFP
jgi:hypothetical protein